MSEEKWEDVSSYSQRAKNREPNSFRIRLGQFSLAVHRHIHHNPDDWLASCYGLFECKRLSSKDLSEAKSQALVMVHVILDEAIHAITGGKR